MTDYTFDEKALRRAAKRLSHRAKIAFALSIAERLYPNYVVFSRRQKWGDPALLRRALDLAWDIVAGHVAEVNIVEELKPAVHDAAPDTGEFSDDLTSAALDAAAVIHSLLGLLLEDEPALVADVASLARDTIDMSDAVRNEIDPNDELEGPDLEEAIRLHPLMQRELERQHADLQLLAKATLEPDEVERLRKQWSNVPTSAINIELPRK